MRLLLDQGLPRSTVLHLRDKGIEAMHVGDKGLATAADSKILDFGRQEGLVVVVPLCTVIRAGCSIQVRDAKVWSALPEVSPH